MITSTIVLYNHNKNTTNQTNPQSHNDQTLKAQPSIRNSPTYSKRSHNKSKTNHNHKQTGHPFRQTTSTIIMN